MLPTFSCVLGVLERGRTTPKSIHFYMCTHSCFMHTCTHTGTCTLVHTYHSYIYTFSHTVLIYIDSHTLTNTTVHTLHTHIYTYAWSHTMYGYMDMN